MNTHARSSNGDSSIVVPTKENMKTDINRNEKLYYADVDIVLLSLPVEDVIAAFKVDTVLLKRASPVFDGMLALPSMEDAEKYDGVPLVRLQDKPDHLEQFLFALYDQ
ncbi:hypothetical protein M422DRAFT_775619, partial [Sphaerobolus stellatus SS14]